MTVRDFYNIINEFAPFSQCMEGDNVGLLVGRIEAQVTKVLVTLDVDSTAINAAIQQGCDLIVSHHPVLFAGEPHLSDRSPQGEKLLTLLEHGIAVISAHTNLDGCSGGVCETLAEMLQIKNLRPFLPMQGGAFVARIGKSSHSDIREFIRFAAKTLKVHPRFVLPSPDAFGEIAVCNGSNAGAIYDAAEIGVKTVITGDVKYSAFMNAREMGINLIDLGHFETEQMIVPKLARLLQKTEIPVICHTPPSPVQTEEAI